MMIDANQFYDLIEACNDKLADISEKLDKLITLMMLHDHQIPSPDYRPDVKWNPQQRTP